MIPKIFISSTILDLQHLRDAIRETVSELSYIPIMSDYGDIGYLPSTTAENSCYVSMRDCQLAILILGKRYSSKASNGVSVTHNEFLTAKESNIPIITIVDSEVMTFKRVYDANSRNTTKQEFPGMDCPEDTFKFINDISGSALNNGILQFNSATEARNHLKKQIAHIFGDLLTKKFDPVKIQLKDVLSEIKTVRHELLKNKGPEPLRYLRATRFLLSDEIGRKSYSELIENIVGSLDSAVPLLLESNTFDEFLKKGEIEINVIEERPDINSLMESGEMRSYTVSALNDDSKEVGYWGVYVGKKVEMNDRAKKYFNHIHEDFRKETNI
ncbi:DUF4062 domain-containing protein [uncultured Desulfuromonas sp.]|uniref:DUF4062 domain-containing protein n=1 Tax=uncultured Desulfuromonas sp. TaxID=181013 RepID=UPI002AAAD520|nr:DUF4062 domain-containing protein [uncultured Desulfuromonas sp.]